MAGSRPTAIEHRSDTPGRAESRPATDAPRLRPPPTEAARRAALPWDQRASAMAARFTEILPPEGSSGWAPLAWFALIALLLCGGLAVLGPYRITIFEQDTFHFFCQGDYLLKGYRPYVDYQSAHGPFPFLFALLGLRLAGPSMWAVLLAQMAGGMFFGALMCQVAAARLRGVWAVGLGVTTLCVLLSFTPPGGKVWRQFSCAEWYNTVGFVCEAILALYVFLPANRLGRLGRTADWAIAGICLAALFLTKITFFAPMAVTFVVGSLVWPRHPRQRWHGLLAGLLAAGLAAGIFLALRGSLAGYLNFYRHFAPRVNPLTLVLRYLQYTQTLAMLLLGAAAVVWAAAKAGCAGKLARELVLAALLTATLLLSVATSCQDPEYVPFLGLVPLLLTAAVLHVRGPSGGLLDRQLLAVALAAATLMLVQFPKDALLSWALCKAPIATLNAPVKFGLDPDTPLPQSPVVDRRALGLLSSLPSGYARRILNGLQLLDRCGARPGEVLLAMTWVDDVTLFTHLRYPHGGTPWWQFFFAASPEAYPPPDAKFLTDVQWVLEDCSDDIPPRFLRHHRGPMLRDCFSKVGQSSPWVLWKRTAGSRAASVVN